MPQASRPALMTTASAWRCYYGVPNGWFSRPRQCWGPSPPAVDQDVKHQLRRAIAWCDGITVALLLQLHSPPFPSRATERPRRVTQTGGQRRIYWQSFAPERALGFSTIVACPHAPDMWAPERYGRGHRRTDRHDRYLCPAPGATCRISYQNPGSVFCSAPMRRETPSPGPCSRPTSLSSAQAKIREEKGEALAVSVCETRVARATDDTHECAPAPGTSYVNERVMERLPPHYTVLCAPDIKSSTPRRG